MSEFITYIKGKEEHSVDNKGRLSIPAKMRKSVSPEAGDSYMLTRGIDKCLALYPIDTWKNVAKRYAGLDLSIPRNRYVVNMINSWTEDVNLDAQQRIVIPKRHLDFAGIENKVLVIGMTDHIEIWDPQEHAAWESKFEADMPFEVLFAEVMSNKM